MGVGLELSGETQKSEKKKKKIKKLKIKENLLENNVHRYTKFDLYLSELLLCRTNDGVQLSNS